MKCIKKNVVHLGQNICKGEKMTELESNKQEPKELELDDLRIGNSEDADEVKEGSSKKIILLSAIGVLLLAIVVLVVYLLQGDSKEQERAMNAQKPVERVEQPTQAQPTQSNDFGQEPIQSNTDDQFQRIIDQIKAQQSQQGNLPSAPETKPEPPKATQVQPTQPTTPIQPEVSKPTAPKQQPADAFKNITTNDPSLQGSEATAGFYIQVGSFSKFSPNKQLIGAIESGKFNYRMQKSGDNNRLLIGPYATKQEAQSKLADIREKINRDAFVKEVK